MKIFSKIIVSLLLLSASMIMVGCASNEDPYAGMSEAQMFQTGQSALEAREYQKAVDTFEAQEAKYPYGDYAHQEQLNIIYAYYQNEDYPSAYSSTERYIHLNPNNRYVDYVYYMKALSGFARNRSIMEDYFPVDSALRDIHSDIPSFNDFNYLIKQYPNSPYVSDARLHMVYIRNAVARNNMEAANYYFERKAYIGALERARVVVFHFQGSPLVPEALEMMYHCYNKLNLTRDAETTLTVIKTNYPHQYQDIQDI